MTTIPPPSPSKVHFTEPGYTCQVYLVLEVYKQVFPSTAPSYRVWFSKGFNPVRNADSSNPAQIYLSLSRAVETHDVGSRIIRGYRTVLLETVEKYVIGINQKKDLISEISGASVALFRPQVWLLDLDAIAKRPSFTSVADLLSKARQHADADVRRVPGQVLQPDEYLIEDLKGDEFIIIIDG